MVLDNDASTHALLVHQGGRNATGVTNYFVNTIVTALRSTDDWDMLFKRYVDSYCTIS